MPFKKKKGPEMLKNFMISNLSPVKLSGLIMLSKLT